MNTIRIDIVTTEYGFDILLTNDLGHSSSLARAKTASEAIELLMYYQAELESTVQKLIKTCNTFKVKK